MDVVEIIPPQILIQTQFFSIINSVLTVMPGYAWDGASGPALDTPNTMVPSLVHDVFYQMIREGLLSKDYRKAIDGLFRQMCRDRGMNWFRAWYFYLAVQKFGRRAIRTRELKAAW